MITYQLQQKIAIFILAFFVLSFYGAPGVMGQGLTVSEVTNDPKLGSQYYLAQIKALQAWSTIADAPEIVVAVIDSGVDIDHPDLAANIWKNQDEIAGDKIDNDNNGYVDDVNGWDFIVDSSDPRPKVAAPYSVLGINHGTLVAGVIGAVGNNGFGLSGVAWKIKIMPLRVMDAQGAGNTKSVYRAIRYAIDNKADIINLSMVGEAFDPSLQDIIAEAYRAGMIIVAAAGNETNNAYQTDDFSLNLGIHPQYPICHDGYKEGDNFILGVGSVNGQDKKSRFSNFGSKCLDLVAPGESFYGTLYFSPVLPEFKEYFGGWWSGTSLAAPQVSAAAALLKAYRPDLKNSEIYEILIKSADNIDARNLNYVGLLGGGRLNLPAALAAAAAASDSAAKLLVAPEYGFAPLVSLYNLNGELRSSFLAYAENFKGGVNLASADIDGDGTKEIITAAGKTGGPHVRVFNNDGTVLKQFFAYDAKFNGGVNIAAQNIDAFGQAKIITAPQSNYQPLIRIFNVDGELLKEWLAFDAKFTGGVNLALGDINGDNEPEIIAASGPGQAPLVRIFTQQGKLVKEFLVGDKNWRGGVKVSAADLYLDSRTEIITIPQAGAKPMVRIYSASGQLELEWSAGETTKDKISITALPRVYAEEAKLLIALADSNQRPQISAFNYRGQLLKNFVALSEGITGGANLAGK
ncbi:MAG: S8 family peptidase [Candidatus Komeilibacteria bacterium]|nr:S8 family peptidase [Candidatus Komeilibacteria bacterium]